MFGAMHFTYYINSSIVTKKQIQLIWAIWPTVLEHLIHISEFSSYNLCVPVSI